MHAPSHFSLFLILALVAFTGARSVLPAAEQGAESLFQDANAAYEKKDFEKAYQLYTRLGEDHGLAPDLFYNLGNTAYRLDKPGEAALWYRRALVLDPGHTESRQNLRFLHDVYQFLSLEQNGVQKLTATISERFFLILSVAAAWGTVLATATLLVFRLTAASLWALALCGTIALASAGVLLMKGSRESLLSRAVVVVDQVSARPGPAEDSGNVISVPPGAEVELLAMRAAWSYVGLPGGIRGWLHSDEIVPLWPFDPSFLE